MHVENKYTDDEAEHIFVAVKGFIDKLARAAMRTATQRLRRSLGLFCDLSEYALEIGAWLLCADLVRHLNEAF